MRIIRICKFVKKGNKNKRLIYIFFFIIFRWEIILYFLSLLRNLLNALIVNSERFTAKTYMRWKRNISERTVCIKQYINIHMRIHLHEAQQISWEKQRGNVCNMQIRHADRTRSWVMRWREGICREARRRADIFWINSDNSETRRRAILDFHEEATLKIANVEVSSRPAVRAPRKKFPPLEFYTALFLILFFRQRAVVSQEDEVPV